MEATALETPAAIDRHPAPERSEAPRAPRRPPLRERVSLAAIRAAFRAGSLLAPGVTAEQGLRYFMTPARIPRPGWENELLKSARRTVLKAGVVAYAWGRGPRVLIVHGWDGRGTQMGRIATAIAEAGFEAICIDLPGHGESPGGMVHVPLVKDVLLKVGEELGPLHLVIGHSFGAGAALYAVYHGLEAERVVYLAGPSRFTELFDRYCDYVGIWGAARTRFDEKIVALVQIHPDENYPAHWALKIDQPGLVIHDRDDEDCPFSEGEEIHKAWRGSRLFATSGLGHRRVLKSQAVIAEIVRFAKGEPLVT